MKRSIKSFLLAALIGSGIQAYTESYYYDDVGRLIQVAYETGSGITYTYDDADNILSVETIFVPPRPPALTSTVSPGVGIALEWDAVSGSDTYRIYRRSDRNLNWSPIAETESDTFAFFDTTVLEDVDYFYRLVAVGNEGLSAYSESTPGVGLSGVSARIQQAGTVGDQPLYLIEFEAEADGVYRVDTTTSLDGATWAPLAYSRSPTGPSTTDPVSGESGPVTLYFIIGSDAHPQFFRLARLPEL